MILRRVCVLLEIGDAMRILCCLLLSVLLIGCGDSKEEAIGAIKELGGDVAFDEKNPGEPVSVDFTFTKVTDSGLRQLKEMTNLQTLYLVDTRWTGSPQRTDMPETSESQLHSGE